MQTNTEDCAMPAEGDPPFRVLLEPCWANTTQGFETVAKDAERCPDVPVEYFRENAQEVLTNDGASDDNIGFVSGLPVELNILSIGKNYAFDPNNEDSQASASALKGKLLSDFQFRTLPIADDAWKFLLAEMDSKVKFLREVTSAFADKPLYPELQIGASLPDELNCTSGDVFNATCVPNNSEFEWLFGYDDPKNADFSVLRNILESFINGNSSENLSGLSDYINNIVTPNLSSPEDDEVWSDILGQTQENSEHPRDISSVCDVQGPDTILKDSSVNFCLQFEIKAGTRDEYRYCCDHYDYFCGPYVFDESGGDGEREQIDSLGARGAVGPDTPPVFTKPVCFSGMYDSESEKINWNDLNGASIYPSDGKDILGHSTPTVDFSFNTDQPNSCGHGHNCCPAGSCSPSDLNCCVYNSDCGANKGHYYDISIASTRIRVDAPVEITKDNDELQLKIGPVEFWPSYTSNEKNCNSGQNTLQIYFSPVHQGTYTSSSPSPDTLINTIGWRATTKGGSDECTSMGWRQNENVPVVEHAKLYLRAFTGSEVCPQEAVYGASVKTAEFGPNVSQAGRIRGCKMRTNTFVSSGARDVYKTETAKTISKTLKVGIRDVKCNSDYGSPSVENPCPVLLPKCSSSGVCILGAGDDNYGLLFNAFPAIEYKQPMLGAIGPVPMNAFFARSPMDIKRTSPLPGKRSQIDYFQTRPEIDALDDMFRQTNLLCAGWLQNDVMTSNNSTFPEMEEALKKFERSSTSKETFGCNNLTQEELVTLKYCYNPKLFYYMFAPAMEKSIGWAHNTIMCMLWYDNVEFNSLGADTWLPYASTFVQGSQFTMYGDGTFGLKKYDYLHDALSGNSGAVKQIVNGCPPRDVDLADLLAYATTRQKQGRPVSNGAINSDETSSFKDDFYMNTLWCTFYDEPYSLLYYPSVIQTAEKKNVPFRRLQRPIINDPCQMKVLYTKDKKEFTYGPRPWNEDNTGECYAIFTESPDSANFPSLGGNGFGLHFLPPRWIDVSFVRAKSSLVNAFLTAHEEKLSPSAPAEELKDQCMGVVTASIIKMDFKDASPRSTVNVLRGEEATWRDRFKGLGIADKILSKDAGLRTIHHALIDEINSMGTVGAFSPMQDFTCPMEVVFGDTRTSSMSYEQQFENIFTSGVTMIKSIGKNAANMGKGCYMCVVPSGDNLYDTLANEPLWARHYDKRTCGITAFLPAMENVPKSKDNPTSFVPPKPKNPDPNCNAADFTPSPTPPPTDETFDPFKLWRPHRQGSHYLGTAGVYTLYPFVKPPSSEQNTNTATQHNWEDALSEQLNYLYDPGWHVTVEVTGISKNKGSKVLRNFHGRLLEENQAELNIEKVGYKERYPINSTKVVTSPNVCLASEFEGEQGVPGTDVQREVECKSDLDSITTKLNTTSKYFYSMDVDNTYEGQSQWMDTIIATPDPISNLIFDKAIMGTEFVDLVDVTGGFNETFFIVQRQDKGCEARVGAVSVCLVYGTMCAMNPDGGLIDSLKAISTGAELYLLFASGGSAAGAEGGAAAAAEGGEAGEAAAAGEEAEGAGEAGEDAEGEGKSSGSWSAKSVLKKTIGAFWAGSGFTSDFQKEGLHTMGMCFKFSSCDPDSVVETWHREGHSFADKANQLAFERVAGTRDLCSDADWVQGMNCLPCQSGDYDGLSGNFVWDQIVNAGSGGGIFGQAFSSSLGSQCNTDFSFNGRSGHDICGDFSYSVSLDPLHIIPPVKFGNRRAHYGPLGAPDGFYTPDAQKQEYKPYNPTVSKVGSSAPCIYQSAAKFFITYNPSSPIGGGGASYVMNDFFGPGNDRCDADVFPDRNIPSQCPDNTNLLFSEIYAGCKNGFESYQVRLCQRDEYTPRGDDLFSAETLKEDVMNVEPWTRYTGTLRQNTRLAQLENEYKTNRSQAILNQIQDLLQQIDDTIEEESTNFDGLAVTTWNVMNVPLAVKDPVQTIVDEINILGVSISTPLFSGTAPNKFPSGLIITSKHPKIHARITRNMGRSTIQSGGCNVLLLGIPNVLIYNVELDNSDCQEQGLNQLLATTPGDEYITNSNLYRRALADLKAWNVAPVHITSIFSDVQPVNISFIDVKITSATSFRNLFPGRPLISVDNSLNPNLGGAVNVDNLYLNVINDTHQYRDTRSNANNVVPLMPLHMILWNFKGRVFMGDFPDVFDVVAYGKKDTYSITNDRIADTYVMENCPGFSEGSYDGYVHHTNASQVCEDANSPCTQCYNKEGGDCELCVNVHCKNTTDFINDCQNSSYGCEIQTSRRQTGTANGSTSASSVLFGAASNSDHEHKQYLLCRRKRYTDASNLLVLDGNDFFDIAYDRFRCFDKPKLDCSVTYLQLVWITLGWLGACALFHLVFRFAKLYGEEDCIEITSTLEEQLREAGLTETAAIVGALVLEEELAKIKAQHD